jgi:hypothetical protein
LKEAPCDNWAKEHNSVPFLGLMASEGGQRADALENKYCPNCGTRYLDNDYTEKKLKVKKEENHQMDIEEWLKGVEE